MTKKLISLFTYVFVILILLLAIVAVSARLMGWQTFTVLSGSMEPEYPTGCMIWVKPVSPRSVEPGQVITFALSESTVATHRVVEILPDHDTPGVLRFRTKGDSNETADAQPVHQNNLIGTPVLKIPGAGFMLDYVRRPPGLYLAIVAGLGLLMLLFLPELAGSSKRDIAGNG